MGLKARYRRMTLRNKMMLSYLVLTVIPILVLGVYAYVQSYNMLAGREKGNLTNTVSKAADNINYKLERYLNIADSFTNNIRFQQMFNNNYEDKVALVGDFREHLDPYISNILYTNSDIRGMTVYSSLGMVEYRDIIRDAQSLHLLTGRDDALPEGATDAWYDRGGTVVLVKSFQDAYSGKSLGFVCVEADKDRMFEGLIPSGDHPYRYGVHTDTGALTYYQGEPEETARQLTQRIPEAGGAVTLGKREYACQRLTLENRWELYCWIPYEEIVGGASSILWLTITIGLACFLVLCVLMMVFARSIVRRITLLNRQMRRVEEGNLDIRVHSDDGDEIGQLTNRFGNMLNNINALINNVYESRIIQKEAELKALQAQIKPHFLYNSLNVISWAAIKNNDTQTQLMAKNLSRFYRTTLNKGQSMTSVADELENVRTYLEIQLVIHENSFDVECDIDPEIMAFQVPNLILQPIAENAVQHGVDLKTEGRGLIRLTAGTAGEDIVFTITDNGPGVPPEKMDRILTEQTSGYGIRNVQERLRLLYGEPYGITVGGGERGGAVFTVRIPGHAPDGKGEETA